MGSALGQAHWPPPQAGATSGRWPTVPGVTHLIACAQVGPIRTPGGPPNPTGRVPHQRLSRALVTPAPPLSLRCWSLPPCFRPQGRPPVPRPLPCPLAPAMSRLPLLSAPAPACWCTLLFFFFCPLPPPMSPRCLLAVLALFVGGWRSRGRGGGGVLAVRPIAQARRKHGAGTRRGTCPSAGGGGGLAVWLPPSPYPSCGCTPGGPAVGACTARAPFGHGRVVRPALSFLCLPTLPRRPRGGGSASHYRHPPCPLAFPSLPSPLSLVGVGVGGGEGGAPSLPFLRRKHVAGTALAHGAAPVLLLGSGARRVAPIFALPTLRSLPRCPPPPGPARRLLPLGTVVWSVPHPHPAAPPSCRFALGRGGRCLPLPSCIPHPWGGGGALGGAGGACRFPFVALMSQARGAASVSLHGGGGVCLVAPVVALSTLRPPSRWSPRRGLHGACSLRARSCGSSRYRRLPTLPRCPRGGGSLVASPLPALPALGGAGMGGGGRCALFVSPPLHARRRQDVGTTQSRGEALGCCGGGGGFCLSLPALLHGLGPAAQDN